LSGQKRFEIRRNDRNYQVGDRLNIQEIDDESGECTGDIVIFDIIYMDTYCQQSGYVVLGLSDQILAEEVSE
jgi:hypothetical protein